MKREKEVNEGVKDELERARVKLRHYQRDTTHAHTFEHEEKERDGSKERDAQKERNGEKAREGNKERDELYSLLEENAELHVKIRQLTAQKEQLQMKMTEYARKAEKRKEKKMKEESKEKDRPAHKEKEHDKHRDRETEKHVSKSGHGKKVNEHSPAILAFHPGLPTPSHTHASTASNEETLSEEAALAEAVYHLNAQLRKQSELLEEEREERVKEKTKWLMEIERLTTALGSAGFTKTGLPPSSSSIFNLPQYQLIEKLEAHKRKRRQLECEIAELRSRLNALSPMKKVKDDEHNTDSLAPPLPSSLSPTPSSSVSSTHSHIALDKLSAIASPIKRTGSKGGMCLCCFLSYSHLFLIFLQEWVRMLCMVVLVFSMN